MAVSWPRCGSAPGWPAEVEAGIWSAELQQRVGPANLLGGLELPERRKHGAEEPSSSPGHRQIVYGLDARYGVRKFRQFGR